MVIETLRIGEKELTEAVGNWIRKTHPDLPMDAEFDATFRHSEGALVGIDIAVRVPEAD
jgi:alpha/beta superfamily hydrolase